MAEDRHTPEALIAGALAEPRDSDARWRCITALHRLATAETFDAAADLCASDDPDRRELGVHVVAELGERAGAHPFREPVASLLLSMLEREDHELVLESVAVAFGHVNDRRTIAALHRLRDHPSDGVRHSVVIGLLGHDDYLAVETLIELSSDEASEVREWATFGLGSQIDRDTARIRDALAARLDDPDVVTRDEAIAGLGARGDARALEPLLERLEAAASEWSSVTLESVLLELACHVDDERIRPRVAQAWATRGGDPDFDPDRLSIDAILLSAARRYGLTR